MRVEIAILFEESGEESQIFNTSTYMNRGLTGATIVSLALAAVGMQLQAQTPDDIAASILHARGGLARIHNLQTERMRGIVWAGDQQGSFVREVKRPAKMRMEITLDGKTAVQTYDGSSGWKLDGIAGNGQVRELSAEEKKRLAEEADLDGPFVDFLSKGVKIEVLDKEMLGPSLVWKLKVTLKSGETEVYYVESTGYYILLRQSTSGGKQGATTYNTLYKDFRRVEGVLFPFTVVSSLSGDDPAMMLQFEEIQLNGTIDDADFGKPSK
jgi:hypothetical protein